MKEESIKLYFKDTRSDKEYRVHLIQSEAGWQVTYQNGRRGGTLTSGVKTETPLPYEEAKEVYDTLVRRQTKKGYTPQEGCTAFVGTELEQRVSGVLPQLLNPIRPEQLEQLLDDDDWLMQEKFDGHRRMVCSKADSVTGINRKGLTVPLSAAVVDAFSVFGTVASKGLTVDAELVGDTLYFFDVLEYSGVNTQDESCDERLARLAELASMVTAEQAQTLKFVVSAYGREAKQKMLDDMKALSKEGVVFKLRSSGYAAGRPSTGGTQLKHKFTHSASVRVAGTNKGKRSVRMELLSEVGVWVEVGNCTVPANQPIPASGAILEVEYLYAYEGGSLFQPVFRFVRDDIEQSACLLTQLHIKAQSDEADE